MRRDLSSRDVAELLLRIGITFKRQGKEDIYECQFRGRTSIVIVPRNKRSIPKWTRASIFRQAGITGSEAERLMKGEDLD